MVRNLPDLVAKSQPAQAEESQKGVSEMNPDETEEIILCPHCEAADSIETYLREEWTGVELDGYREIWTVQVASCTICGWTGDLDDIDRIPAQTERDEDEEPAPARKGFDSERDARIGEREL